MLHDKDIREPLFDFLEETYGKIRIIEEKTMGKSRADVVMVTEKNLVGIEIKSDADTYTRLSGQVKDYDKYYDRNIAVVGSSHALHIKEHVPDDVFDFYILRSPGVNPNLKLKNKLRILWRPELYALQQKYEMPKYKDKSKDFVISKISERVPDIVSVENMNEDISGLLFERDYTNVEETLKEYRKGELQKVIDLETDPQKKLEYMVMQADKKASFPKRKRKRRR